MIPKLVYRGVKLSTYERTGEALIPKIIGDPLATLFDRSGAVTRTRGGDARDLGASRVASVGNTVLLHQLRQEGYPTSFVSTTPHQANAEKYALHEEASGVIYVIDTTRLADWGVEAFVVQDFVPVPSIPDDEEIILRARDGGPLPSEIVAKILPVRR